MPEIVPERSTHLLHSYPAKLLPQIPHFFVRAHSTMQSGTPITIADPFCGSGTVLVEGILSGCPVVGADSNPLARLIARVKTCPIDRARIIRQLARIHAQIASMDEAPLPRVVNVELWYKRTVANELAKLAYAINCIRADDVREFMQLCLSVCARRMSRADPRLSVPVRINPHRKKKYGTHYEQLRKHLRAADTESTTGVFDEIVRRNCSRLRELDDLPARPMVRIYDEARELDRAIDHNSIDLIITSPPYIGAQKYIRASSFGLGWLGLSEASLRALEDQNIGREHFPKRAYDEQIKTGILKADRQLSSIRKINPLRAHIAAQYLREMRESLKAMHASLRNEGSLVLVVGPNTICGQAFDTPRYLEILANEIGLRTEFKLIDHIRSRGLMVKRNKTAGMISSEWVLYLRKTND
ncbi:hypothetical protein [Bradyrhizobium japonicum]|uniref:hypothetical protein n=1 Tax=Bradyrhizobium japonicum TaxID=375 RepID=UPI00271512AD|nr:hypothetical protein [Bradyrhizobium japonicum]WLB53800.1 hypothetical protein QIH94_42460 [Bradyrhizobium japonicum]WLB64327.1 hypothetical protein QIH96_03325 [Bradyrhizobium japonicum]